MEKDWNLGNNIRVQGQPTLQKTITPRFKECQRSIIETVVREGGVRSPSGGNPNTPLLQLWCLSYLQPCSSPFPPPHLYPLQRSPNTAWLYYRQKLCPELWSKMSFLQSLQVSSVNFQFGRMEKGLTRLQCSWGLGSQLLLRFKVYNI